MRPTRRDALILGAATVAASQLAMPSLARAAAPFAQPKLPYAEDALSKVISARTVGLHYGKHHAGYFKTLNEMVTGTSFADMTLEEVVIASRPENQKLYEQAAQAWNHVLYWNQFAGGPVAPEGNFLAAVERDFGDLAGLKTAIKYEAGKVFGTGWVWLATTEGRLSIAGMTDAGNPLASGVTPMLGIDVWEHAYYLDFENRKSEHVQQVLDQLVNWKFVGDRMG